MNQTVSHYRLLETIGVGGMGQVWKAEDLKLQRTVAIKFAPPELVGDQQARQRIIGEARAAAAINHPNIATVYEIGEDAGRLFIVMEYVEGRTLRSRIEQGPFEISAALDVAIQVAEALSAAHTRGLIHCDIKDSNVMITPGGVVKVLDFGLAKTKADPLTGLSRNERSMQEDGEALLSSSSAEQPLAGTLHYLAPEQIRSGKVNGQTDLFSLGVVLYEMLTGRHPFDGDDRASVLKAILDAEPRPLSAYRDDVPLELERAVRNALEKDQQQRYATAEAFRENLLTVQASASEGTRAAGLVSSHDKQSLAREFSPLAWREQVQSFVWRFRKWIAAVGVVALLAATLDILSVRDQGVGWSRALALFALALLCFLAASVRWHRAMRSIQSRASGIAFRGLLPFQEADRDRFYGRDLDAAALFDLVAHNEFRFGVLFGDSGCGKTSLVHAGLLPKLWEEGYVPIYCRSYKNPLSAVIEECRKRVHAARLEGEPAIDYVKRVAEEAGLGLVIVFDQFEEFFVSFRSKREREPLISFLAECHRCPALRVKFIFSMRSDFLYLISSEFVGRIGEPLMSSTLYHLRNFDQEQAAEIIERSVRKANLAFEPGLSREVARDLSVDDVVLPSELQIVGDRLQSKRIYTVQEYRKAGGKEPLVHSFLEDVIQASGDGEGARLVMRSLISEENTRVTLPLDEIARRTQRSAATVERLLNLFVQSRLIREIQEDEPWRYELMHEYLIEKINQITGRVMDATQRANRLLRQYLSASVVDARTTIPLGKLWFIRRYTDAGSGERARELMRKSLRRGLVKAGAIGSLLVLATTMSAAALSVTEVWEGVRLNGGHTAAARKIALSPDGRLLVSVGEDARVIVWDFAQRQRLATFTDHTAWVISVAFSPDGKWFATASDDQTVIVWDAVKLEKTATLTEHKGPARTVAFSSDSRLLASASKIPDPRTIIWEVGKWEKVREWPRGADWENVLFSPDGGSLIYAQGETWDVTTGQRLTGPLDPVGGGTHAALTANGTRLVNVNGEGNVGFYDMTRTKLIRSYRAHRFHGRATAFSADDKLAASGAEDIVLWDATTQTKLARLIPNTEVWGLVFSPDGRWLVSSHEDGAIVLWDVNEREPVANFNEHDAAVRAVAFSPDGKTLASASEDRSIIEWDVASGRKEAALIGHDSRVTALAFSPDGKQIASCDQDGVHILWDVGSGRARWKVDGFYFNDASQKKEGRSAYCLAFSPDGRFIGTNGVLDSADGKWIVEHDDFAKAAHDFGVEGVASIYGVAFSPDGTRLALATPDSQSICLLDTERWQVIDSLKFSDAFPNGLSFSPDGRYLALGETGGRVLLLQANPLKQVAVLGRHAARVKSVAFSPDGRRVVSSSDDRTIALWNVNSPGLIARIGSHTAPVLSVAFSPDGKRLASGEQDKSARIYTRHRTLWGFRLD